MNKLIEQVGIVPVVVIEDAGDAVPLATALIEGGLSVIEITLRTAAAVQAIENIAEQLPEVVVGAGTVLSVDQLQLARDAGARFIVSPGLDPGLVEAAGEAGLPVYPGIATATELQTARNLGLRTVKFFPAQLSGGVDMVKTLSAVFRDMRFMPTGGISADELPDYLALEAVIACGGSWLTPASAIAERDFARITRLAIAAREIVTKARH